MVAFQNHSTVATPPSMVLSQDNFDSSLRMSSEDVSFFFHPTHFVPGTSFDTQLLYHPRSPQQPPISLNVFAAPFTPGPQQHTAMTLNIDAPEFIPGAFRASPYQVPSTLDPLAAPFIPSAQQQVSTTLNIDAPEFIPGAYHASSTRPTVYFPPEGADSWPVLPQQLDYAYTSPPMVDVRTVAVVTDGTPPAIPVVKLPPSTTSGSSSTRPISRQVCAAVRSLRFVAQENFDGEAYFQQRIQAEKAKVFAEDQAQRLKEHASRKAQRTTWLESRTEEQLEALAEVLPIYDVHGEVNVGDMESKPTDGLFYSQGFYYPTPSNCDDTSPLELIPFRDLKRFPLPELESQERSREIIELERQGQVVARYYQRTLCLSHHINFFGRVVPVKSTTRPATTIAILTHNLGALTVTPPDGSWKSTVMASAMLFLDPIIFCGERETLKTPGASKLEEACIDSAHMAYSEQGWWAESLTREDAIVTDKLDPYTYSAGAVIMNGVTAGFLSRETIIAAASTKQHQDREARQAACQERMARGRVRSRLGLSCVTQEDLTEVPAFVPRLRTESLSPSKQHPTAITNSVQEPSDETEAEDTAAQESNLEDADSQEAQGTAAEEESTPAAQGAASTVLESAWHRRMREIDAASGYQSGPLDWSEEVEEDEVDALPAATTVPNPAAPVLVVETPVPTLPVEPPVEIETPFNGQGPVDVEPLVDLETAPDVEITADVDTVTDIEIINDVEAPVNTEVPVYAEAPADTEAPVNVVELTEDPAPSIEGTVSDVSRRASASTTEAPVDTDTATPPTSPELGPDDDDDEDSIYGDVRTTRRLQTPPLAANQLDIGHIEALALDEEFRLIHGEALPGFPTQITAERFQAALDGLNAEMEAARALAPPRALTGAVLPLEPVIQIPGLGLIDEADETPTAAAVVTPQPDAQALVVPMTPIRRAAPPAYILQMLGEQVQEIGHIIPGQLRGQPYTTLHRFLNGTETMTLPGQSFGLIRSPAMVFEAANPLLSTIPEKGFGDEENVEESTPALTFVEEDPLPDRVIEEVPEEEIDGNVINENVALPRDTHLSNVVMEDIADNSARENDPTSPSSPEFILSPSSANGSSTNIGDDIHHMHPNRLHVTNPSMATTASAYSSMATLYNFGDSLAPSAYNQWPDFDSVCYPHIPPRTSSLAWNQERPVPSAESTLRIMDNLLHDAGVPQSPLRLPASRRTPANWQTASWNIISRKLTKRRPATTATNAITIDVRSQDEILTRAHRNEGVLSEFPESRRVSDGSVTSRMGKKTTSVLRKSIAKLKGMLGKKK